MLRTKKNELSVPCLNCSYEKTWLLGFGEYFSGYFHCPKCGHDFTVNLAKEIEDATTQKRVSIHGSSIQKVSGK